MSVHPRKSSVVAYCLIWKKLHMIVSLFHARHFQYYILKILLLGLIFQATMRWKAYWSNIDWPQPVAPVDNNSSSTITDAWNKKKATDTCFPMHHPAFGRGDKGTPSPCKMLMLRLLNQRLYTIQFCFLVYNLPVYLPMTLLDLKLVK